MMSDEPQAGLTAAENEWKGAPQSDHSPFLSPKGAI